MSKENKAQELFLEPYRKNYSDVISKISSLMKVLSKIKSWSSLTEDECYILQMSPAKNLSKDRFSTQGKLFDITLHIGIIFPDTHAESRIKRIDGENNSSTYVNFRSKRRSDDMGGISKMCADRDMWFLVEIYPDVELIDIRSQKGYRNATFFLKSKSFLEL